jgi:hypothetical protein
MAIIIQYYVVCNLSKNASFVVVVVVEVVLQYKAVVVVVEEAGVSRHLWFSYSVSALARNE